VAPRKAPLGRRIAAMGAGHPSVKSAAPGTPGVMPLARVTVGAAQGSYVTLGGSTFTPLFTADGAMIPETAPGTWGQLVAAGRPA
jgi:hypothetical protein